MALSSNDLLWEMRGRSGKPLICVLTITAPTVFEINLMMGESMLVAERFSDRADALAYGAFLLADFSEEGWTETYRREPFV